VSQHPTVAVVGLGRMGSAMARRVVAAGLPLVVANRSPDKARAFAGEHDCAALRPSAALGAAEVCVTSVSDSAALEELVSGEDGLLAGDVPGGRVLIDASTVSVESSRRVADALEARGVGYLRAPVSGNPAVVDAGNLALMVSGDSEAFARARQVIEAIGPTVFYIGDAEQARVMKLALNLMVAGTAELIAEAVVLAEANDLPREQALEVMCGSVLASPFLKYKAPALIARDYTATATTDLLAKDLDLVADLADGSGVTLPAAELVRRLLHETADSGHREQDFMALALRLEADARVVR
jgi:3-hydroxyisobutyrate dehydrogenase-like beta-hydroxyacid dehydrogenase